jgi:hypothetical protein
LFLYQRFYLLLFSVCKMWCRSVFVIGLLVTVRASDDACSLEDGCDSKSEAGHAMLQTQQARQSVSKHVGATKLCRVKASAAMEGHCKELAVADEGIGASASLDEAGYLAVAKTCCNLEMEKFVRRVIASLDLDVCDDDGVKGFVPWFTCADNIPGYNDRTGPGNSPPYFTGSYAMMVENLHASVPPEKCWFVAPTGKCGYWPGFDTVAECKARGTIRDTPPC